MHKKDLKDTSCIKPSSLTKQSFTTLLYNLSFNKLAIKLLLKHLQSAVIQKIFNEIQWSEKYLKNDLVIIKIVMMFTISRGKMKILI